MEYELKVTINGKTVTRKWEGKDGLNASERYSDCHKRIPDRKWSDLNFDYRERVISAEEELKFYGGSWLTVKTYRMHYIGYPKPIRTTILIRKRYQLIISLLAPAWIGMHVPAL